MILAGRTYPVLFQYRVFFWMMRTRDAAISVIHIESGSEVLVTSEDPKATNRAFSETLGGSCRLGRRLEAFPFKDMLSSFVTFPNSDDGCVSICPIESLLFGQVFLITPCTDGFLITFFTISKATPMLAAPSPWWWCMAARCVGLCQDSKSVHYQLEIHFGLECASLST